MKILGIDFAPLEVPFERRLQTFVPSVAKFANALTLNTPCGWKPII
jgi:hypothetical protein